MASSDPELKDGFTLPVWMKTKPAKDFEPFAASPPAPEDSFFYIRYPKPDVLFGKAADEPKMKLDQDMMKGFDSKEVSAAAYGFRDKDWSKHTKPCQDVLHGIAPINTAVNPAVIKPKPAGTDDGFKGEGAACGSSIVKVAHQMISSTRPPPRGFTVASPEEEAEAPDPRHYNLSQRRGSRSLPTTPNSSPTSRRRKNHNRYFTSPFEPVSDGSSRSWLTAALLGFKKDITASSSTLAEEDDIIENRLHGAASLAQSVESLGPSPRGKPSPSLLNNDLPTPSPSPAPSNKPSTAFRAKPSELREMNFWSPTSM